VIRPIRRDDIAKLKSLGGFEWEFGLDFIEGLVSVDANDQPIMFAGAWHRAEVHIAVDAKYSTPGARLLLLKELHDAMQAEMRSRGIGQAVTWFDETKDRFKQRLQSWGWIESQKKSWHKEI